LRNTISLRGRPVRQGFLHWSNNFDEVQDFEKQIRDLARGTGPMTDAQFTTGTRSLPLGTRKPVLARTSMHCGLREIAECLRSKPFS
jgi:hypothetical protein